MKKFNDFREAAADDSEEMRAKAERRAKRKQEQLKNMQMEEMENETPEADKDEPTAYHPSEVGHEGDETPPEQGGSEKTEIEIAPNTEVTHPKYGVGKVLSIKGQGIETKAEIMFSDGIKSLQTYEVTPKEE